MPEGGIQEGLFCRWVCDHEQGHEEMGKTLVHVGLYLARTSWSKRTIMESGCEALGVSKYKTR